MRDLEKSSFKASQVLHQSEMMWWKMYIPVWAVLPAHE